MRTIHYHILPSLLSVCVCLAFVFHNLKKKCINMKTFSGILNIYNEIKRVHCMDSIRIMCGAKANTQMQPSLINHKEILLFARSSIRISSIWYEMKIIVMEFWKWRLFQEIHITLPTAWKLLYYKHIFKVVQKFVTIEQTHSFGIEFFMWRLNESSGFANFALIGCEIVKWWVAQSTISWKSLKFFSVPTNYKWISDKWTFWFDAEPIHSQKVP